MKKEGPSSLILHSSVDPPLTLRLRTFGFSCVGLAPGAVGGAETARVPTSERKFPFSS